MKKIGHALIRLADGEILAHYGLVDDDDQLKIVLPEDGSLWGRPGWSNGSYAVVDVMLDDPGRPSRWHSVSESEVVVDGLVVVTRSYPVEPDLVPASVSKLQLRTALLSLGLWDEIKAVLDADPAARETFDLASNIAREHPLVAQFALAFEMSEAQVDAIFRSAAG